MAVDILFIIMAAFGFYFGFTFGLMKAVLAVISLIIAIAVAMGSTPMMTNLMSETFQLDTVFLPFIAFGVTLLVVLMLARIVTKLIEETVDNKQFNLISQIIGGIMMALVFTLLYSVLVIFFGQAKVLDLVFNDDAVVAASERPIKLVIPVREAVDGRNRDTLYVKIEEEPNEYPFSTASNVEADENASIALNMGFELNVYGEYQAYIGSRQQHWDIFVGDTVQVRATQQIYLMVEEEMRCFCDSVLLIEAIGDTIYFDCTDDYLAAKSNKSRLYPYIEVIPRRGTQLIKGVAPFLQDFIDYMGLALERINKRDQNRKRPKNVFSNEKSTQPVQPVEESIDPPGEFEPELAPPVPTEIDTFLEPEDEPLLEEDSLSNENVEYEE